jgi:ubiquinone/menaquinone biosynthesis C-methylase UbiE
MITSSEKKHSIDRDNVHRHFNEIASQYDSYKQRASYYHSYLKHLLKDLIGKSEEKSILEIGCGTGAVLAFLNPLKGFGVDISEKMIDAARVLWSDRNELSFEVGEAETLHISEKWDVVFMADVLEHLYDSEAAVKRLGEILSPGTLLILTWANSLWSPVLHLLEILKMKMPEGDHHWEARKTVVEKLMRNGFSIQNEGTRCLIPARLPCADYINRTFIKSGFFSGLGLIRFCVAVKE